MNDRFAKKLGLTYPLVGDPEASIVRAYDVRWPAIGKAQRVTYLIGRDSRVELAFHSERKVLEHVARAKAGLEESRPRS